MVTILHTTFPECNHPVYQRRVYGGHNARMKDDYKRLLKAAAELKDWQSPSEVALGLTRGGYSVTDQMLTNWKSRGISNQGLVKASKIIGCRTPWLESGEGDMTDLKSTLRVRPSLTSTLGEADMANTAPTAPLVGRVPVISWVRAGEFCGIVNLYEPGDAEDWLPRWPKHGKHTYALKITGDSMVAPYPGQRTYPPGCWVYVDPDVAVTNGCRVIAKLPDSQEATFKQYVEDGGKRYLKPLNPQYPTMEMTEGMLICGVVVGKHEDE